MEHQSCGHGRHSGKNLWTWRKWGRGLPCSEVILKTDALQTYAENMLTLRRFHDSLVSLTQQFLAPPGVDVMGSLFWNVPALKIIQLFNQQNQFIWEQQRNPRFVTSKSGGQTLGKSKETKGRWALWALLGFRRNWGGLLRTKGHWSTRVPGDGGFSLAAGGGWSFGAKAGRILFYFYKCNHLWKWDDQQCHLLFPRTLKLQPSPMWGSVPFNSKI